MDAPIIRPMPEAFADFTGQKYEVEAKSNVNTKVKQATSLHEHGTRVFLTTSVEYPEKGILMNYKDVKFKRQGFVFPEAAISINNLKKFSVIFLAVIRAKGIKGRIGAFLGQYVALADWVFQWYNPNTQLMSTIYLQENRYRQSLRELTKFINQFLNNLKIYPKQQESPKDFGRAICTMLEYDNAYHWRLEDVLSETSKELLLKNPRKELKRLLKIYKEREHTGIDFKAEAIIKASNILFFIPSVKKAFKKAIESIDVEKLKMTESDLYFALNYDGYDFKGLPLEERQKRLLIMNDNITPERLFVPHQ